MKTKIHLWLVAAALFWGIYACSEPAKTPEMPNGQMGYAVPSGDSAIPLVSLCHQCDSTGNDSNSCGGDRKVKLSCVNTWEDAWIADLKAREHSLLDSSRGFKLKNLAILESACPSCESVRIYFGWRFNDSLTTNQLALMMVNVDPNSCSDSYKTPNGQKGPILMSAISRFGKNYEYFVDTNVAKKHAEAWTTEYYPDTDSKYFPVNSYTFNKSALHKIRDKASEKIVVNLATHHVDTACVHHYDSRGQKQGQVIDLVIRADKVETGSSNFEYMDFAAPCPKICGKGLFD